MLVSRNNFLEVIERFSNPGFYGLDTETTGLREDDSLFSVILSDADDAYYFNFNDLPDHLGTQAPSDLILPREWIIELNKITRNKDTTVFIHNAKFDMRMLAKEGIVFDCRVACTYALARVERNNHFGGNAYSLAACAKRIGEAKDETVAEYVDKNGLYTKVSIPGKDSQDKLVHYERVPFGLISSYGLKDGHLHRKLGLHLWESISGQPELVPVAENELRLTKTCFRMERVGVLIDRAYTSKGLSYEQQRLHRAKEQFLELTGRPYDNSKKTLLEVFTEAGEKIPMTANGNHSLTDDVLDDMVAPAAKAVQEIRYHEKRISTYYSSFLHLADRDGRLHADCRQAGTETGRFSYREPNLQNIPKEDEDADLAAPFQIRGCIVPSPGFFFVPIDYKQQEYRMMLDYAGEKALISAIMAGADVHQATADMVGISRKQAKTLNFAILYGSGAEKLAGMLNISINEARQLKDRYFSKLPRVENLIAQVRGAGQRRGYIKNWLGRRCHISDPSFAYILPNHLIQGGCADVVKVAMNRLDDFLADRKSRMVLQVHDEILFEVAYEEVGIVPELQRIMEDVYPSRNGMKLEASVEYSFKSWSAKDKIKGMPNETDVQTRCTG